MASIATPIVKTLRRGKTNSQRLNAAFAPATIPQFTVATVPAAALYNGQMIRVSDGAAGSACLALSDGTNWKQVAIGANISAT